MTTATPDWADLTREQKEAIIRPLWLGGKSAGEISHYFVGASRNAVIGVITRAKMGSRAALPNRARGKAEGKRLSEAKAAKKIQRLPMAAPAFVSHIPEPEPIRPGAFNPLAGERPPIEGAAPISILELPNRPGGRCRFPVIGGYCGVHAETTYCPTHSRYAYQQRTEQNAGLRKRK